MTIYSSVYALKLDFAIFHIAKIAVNAITNVECEVYWVKIQIAQFNLYKGKIMTGRSELQEKNI